MNVELLDESIMGLISEVETSAFHLLDLKRRAKGSISSKNGYLYRQWKEGNKWKYERIDGNIETETARLHELKELYRREKDRLCKLNGILIKTGIFAVNGLPGRILNLLASEGIISEHGMLTGTFAFFAYQAALGFSLKGNLTRTSDIDLVRPPEMQILTENINLSQILNRLKIPYVPDGPGGKIVRYVFHDGFKVEILFPHLKGRPQDTVPPGRSGFSDTGAQELKFFRPLLKNPIRTVLISRKGPLPVTVPDPVRFLLHKLVVSGLRNQPSKALKDIVQAEIIAYTMNKRAMLSDIEEVLPDFQGKKIKKYLINGIERLKTRNQNLGQVLKRYITNTRVILAQLTTMQRQ